MGHLAALLVVFLAPAALADDGADLLPLADNSFLIEEAYNQEAGVLQNIATFARDRDTQGWVASFTQEWPLFGQTHQIGFTLPYARLAGQATEAPHGVGDLAINYRYQAVNDEKVALAPRLSLLLPTGDSRTGLGAGGVGAQVNLPLSVVLSRRLVTHVNLGASWTPGARTPGGASASSLSYFIGQSLVALVHPRFNVLVEVLWSGTESASGGITTRSQSLAVSPGIRAGFDLPGGLQIVPGIGVPIGVGPSAHSVSVLGYLSVEFPFTRTHPENG